MSKCGLAALAALLLVAAPLQAREIAFTFDDAPRKDGHRFTGAERTEALVDAMERGGVEGAIFFATTQHIDEAGDARLRHYQAAGHFIGNHSHTHGSPHGMGLEAYLEDLREADRRLRDYPAFLPLYRFPFLNEGRDEALRDGIRAALADMGYRHGYVTVDNYDWYMEHLYQRALAEGRPVNEERLRERYVSLLVDAVNFYDSIALETLGRSPKHVLLLHENDLAALFVDDLALALKAEGWTIIPGPEAYTDPIAETLPDTLFNGQGRVAALAAVAGVPRRQLVHEAEDEAWLEADFEAHGVFGGETAWRPFDSDLLFSSNQDGKSQVYVRRASEDAWIALTDHPGGANYPVWSPDGTRIAYQVRDNDFFDIWVMDADGGRQRRLTDHPDHDYLPSWSPDGQSITFMSWRQEAGDAERANHLYRMNADGGAQQRMYAASPGNSAPFAWSPDGRFGVQTRRLGGEGGELYRVDPDTGDGTALTADGRYNGAAVFSPTGGHLAFYSAAGDDSRIDVMAVDGSGRRTLVDGGANWMPGWSPDGCWVVYAVSRDAEHSDIDVLAVPADGTGDPVVLAAGEGRQSEASWRPQPGLAPVCGDAP